MRMHRFSLKSLLLTCFMAVVCVLIGSSMVSQRAYQNFYRNFAKEYELLVQMIELKNDVTSMYNSTTTLSGRVTYRIKPNLETYEEAYQHAKKRISNLRERFGGELYHAMIDIGNMFMTFDENFQEYLTKREENYSIYLATDVQYLMRLEGYIKDEITHVSEMLTVEAKLSYDQFAADLDRIQLRFYVITTLSIILSIYFSLWTTGRISGSILLLVHRMKRFAKDGTDYPKARTSNIVSIRELDELETSYDTMVKEIEQKNIVGQELSRQKLENLQTRSLLKGAELSMLRMQIDPHFLFNTLNSIGALAEIENAPHTGEMVARLAEMLRYSMNAKTPFTMLKQELMIVEAYVAIQQKRFGDKLSYISHVSQKTLTWLIPSMVIQPLIENALQHGFPTLKAGDYIELNVKLEENELIISVRDNGVGMNPKLLSEISLFDPDNTEKNHGIGLGNLLHRMRLMYGKGYVTVDSIKGVGTCVTVRIPGKTEKMNEYKEVEI